MPRKAKAPLAVITYSCALRLIHRCSCHGTHTYHVLLRVAKHQHWCWKCHKGILEKELYCHLQEEPHRYTYKRGPRWHILCYFEHVKENPEFLHPKQQHLFVETNHDLSDELRAGGRALQQESPAS